MTGLVAENSKKFSFQKQLKKSQLGILMLLIVSLVAVVPAVSNSTATVSVEPSSIVDTTKVPGETFTVDIVVVDHTGAMNLYGFDIKVGYNTTILNATNVALGDFFPPDSWVLKQEINDTAGADPIDMGGDPAMGYAWYAATLPFGTVLGLNGTGTLFTVTFTVDALGEAPLHLYGGDPEYPEEEPYTVLLLDPVAEEISRTVVDGYFDNRPEAIRDVAITSVSANQTAAQIGRPVKITVIVQNQGELSETFTVTVYYDDTAAAPTQTVTDLDAAVSTTLEFIWDTSGVAEGTYTIRANASEVPDEVDTSDNILEDGEVTIQTEPILVHNIGITNVVPSKTEATIGETLSIDVEVRNKGDYSESFDVAVYYDSSLVGTETVTDLASGESRTLTFTWPTADVDADTYTISATASTVADETNTDDNSRTDGQVTLLVPTTDYTLYILAGIVTIGVIAAIVIYFSKLRK